MHRQYKINHHSGRREGNFGRPAKSGLPLKVRKPHMFDDAQWRKAKAEWLKMNEQERETFEKELQALKACCAATLDEIGKRLEPK